MAVLKKSLPQSVEAEVALIGALLYDNLVYEKIADFLSYEHFYDPVNKRIFKAIVYLIDKGHIANPITVWPAFANDDDIKQRGGEAYLRDLTNSVFSISCATDYAKQVLDSHIRREMIRIGSEIIEKSENMDVESSAVQNMEYAENKLFLLANNVKSTSNIMSFNTLLRSVVDTAHTASISDTKVVGVPTGFIDLDRHLGGLHKSDLLILAGRPSMGKTALATSIGFSAAKMYNKPVVFFSLEMSAEQLAMRILAQEADIQSDKIRKGMISQSEVGILRSKAQGISSVPFFVDDTPALTISGLRTRARRLHRQEKIGLIIIDYLQLIQGGISSENRVQELSFITRSLKALAKELDIPVLALSQLSRAVEQRDDKRPQLADLRESGSLEQDADVVMFIYREEYYEARKKPQEGSAKMIGWQENMSKIHNLAELMIAKQRHGPIKNINLYYNDGVFGNYMQNPVFYE